jgi:hypothetical protein
MPNTNLNRLQDILGIKAKLRLKAEYLLAYQQKYLPGTIKPALNCYKFGFVFC